MKLEVGRNTQKPRDGDGILMQFSEVVELVLILVLRGLKGVS